VVVSAAVIWRARLVELVVYAADRSVTSTASIL
jgi:hypothetical protein